MWCAALPVAFGSNPPGAHRAAGGNVSCRLGARRHACLGRLAPARTRRRNVARDIRARQRCTAAPAECCRIVTCCSAPPRSPAGRHRLLGGRPPRAAAEWRCQTSARGAACRRARDRRRRGAGAGRHRLFFGEGFDYARLATLFLALPISWRGTHATKREVLVYVDVNEPMLAKMAAKRETGYRSLGYRKADDRRDSGSLVI